MPVLIAGLVVFLAAHCAGLVAPAWRARQIARIGLRPWKLAYSAISLAGLVLIVAGIVVSVLFALYLHGPLIGVRPFG